MGTTRGSGGNDDIVFGATVDDQTLEFFNRFDRNVERLAIASEDGFERVEKSIDAAGPRIGVLAGLVGGLTTKLLEMGMQGLAAIKNFVQGSIQLTAHADVLETTLASVGEAVGYTSEEIAAAEAEVKSMGITTIVARQSLIRMARANIGWADAAKLARVAQNAAVETLTNSSDAYNRLILGIQKMEPELLDELGIQLNRTRAYEKMGAALDKNVSDLSRVEKQQAILNAIYEQSEITAGNYENAMENAGKQAGSMARHVEELQLSLGRAFQPAYAAAVQTMTGELKKLRDWFAENEDEVQKFSRQLGVLAQSWLRVNVASIDMLKKTPALIEEMGLKLAQAMNMIVKAQDPEQLEESHAQWKTSLKLLGGIFVLFARTAGSALAGFVQLSLEEWGLLVDQMKAGAKVIKGAVTRDWDLMQEGIADWDEAEDAAIKFMNNISTRGDEIIEEAKRVGEEGFNNYMAWADGVGQATDEAEEEVEQFADSSEEDAARAAAAMKEVEKALQELKDEMELEAEERVIKEQRRQIEEELRLSHKRADIERGYQERIQRIRDQARKNQAKTFKDQAEEEAEFAESAADQRAEVEERKAERIIDIERDYRERIQDIQNSYEKNAEEAARARDADALRQLKNQRDDELSEAEKTRERQKADAQRDYEKRLRDLNEALAEEKAAMEQAHQEELAEQERSFQENIQNAKDWRTQQYEALQRSQDREQEIRELHNKWKKEDRQRELEQELLEMGEHFAEIEGLTREGLEGILAEWEEYFGGLESVIEGFSGFLAGQTLSPTEAPNTPYTGPYDTGYGGGGGDDDYSWSGGGGNPYDGPYGQAGQVSSLLNQMMEGSSIKLDSSMLTEQLGRLPPAPGGGGRGRGSREIKVTVDAPNLDIQIQRQLVKTIAEVERNRGS